MRSFFVGFQHIFTWFMHAWLLIWLNKISQITWIFILRVMKPLTENYLHVFVFCFLCVLPYKCVKSWCVNIICYYQLLFTVFFSPFTFFVSLSLCSFSDDGNNKVTRSHTYYFKNAKKPISSEVISENQLTILF